MAIARGHLVRPVDFEIPTLTLPYEQLQANMLQMQQQKDTFDQLTSMMPKHLQQDSEEAGVYRSMLDNAVGSVTEAFATGRTGDAMRMLRTAQKDLVRAWQPGGLAYALEDRYKATQEHLESIREHTKDFTQPAYRPFFEHQLMSQLEGGMNFNPNSGTYTRIQEPQLFGELDTNTLLSEFAEGWAADKGYRITMSPDGFWYNIETEERVDTQELTSAMRNFMRQPHIQQAMGVQGWYREQSIPEEAKPQMRQMYQQQFMAEGMSMIEEQREQAASMNRVLTNGRAEEIAALQQQLIQAGYELTPNGRVDSATRAAVQDFQTSLNANLDQREAQLGQMVEQLPLQHFIQRELEDNLINAYVPRSDYIAREVKMVVNTPYLQSLRLRAQQTMLDGFIGELTRPTPTVFGDVDVDESMVLNIPDQLERARDNYLETTDAYAQTLPPALKDVLIPIGGTPAQMAPYARAMTTAIRDATDAQGNFSFELYVKALEDSNINFSTADLERQRRVVTDPKLRVALVNLNDQLEPAHMAVRVAEDNLTQVIDQASQTFSDDNWRQVSEHYNDVMNDIVPGLDQDYNLSPAQMKREFERGNPYALQAFNNYVKEDKIAMSNLEGLTTISVSYNKELEGYTDAMLEVIGHNPLAFINEEMISEQTADALGYTEQGELRTDDEGNPIPVKVEQLLFGTRNVGGRNVPVISVRTNASDTPVMLSPQELQTGFIRDYLIAGAGLAINPNTFQIRNEQEFDTFASHLYDLEVPTGTGYDANTIYNMMRVNNYGNIGVETPSILGERRQNVRTYLMRDQDGDNYLVVNSNPLRQEVDSQGNVIPGMAAIIENMDGVIKPEHLNLFDGSRGAFRVPIRNATINGIKEAINTAKATYTGTMLHRHLVENPEKLTRSRTNVTPYAAGIIPSILNFE